MSKTTWQIDAAHSGIHFTVKHMVVARVRGQFRRYEADLVIDEADPTQSSVAVTIEAASVDTGNESRDTDLRSPNFFDAERYPKLTFRSRSIERANGDAYRLVGELTIRDVTREVALDVELAGFVADPWGGRRGGFSARGKVLRSAFGMVWNQLLEAGGVAVSDEVEIGIEIEAVAQSPKEAAA